MAVRILMLLIAKKIYILQINSTQKKNRQKRIDGREGNLSVERNASSKAA